MLQFTNQSIPFTNFICKPLLRNRIFVSTKQNTMRFKFLLLLIATGLHSTAQFKNQNEILAKYISGNYTVYRNDQGKLDKVNKVWPITINKASSKDAAGNDLVESILVKRAGVVDELFVPDLKEQPGYFSYDANKLIFFDDYAAYYKQTSSNGSVSYDVLYEFIPEGGSSKSLKAAAEDIAAYRTATLNSQGGTRQAIAQNQAANEAKEREENSTKGKTVKSIAYQPVDIPAQLGLMSKLKFGVIATLADGVQLKTKNLGGKSEFEDCYIIEAPGCNFADGVLEVGLNADAFPNDEIVLTIKNKNNPSQSITQRITLNYESPFFTYSSGGNGNSGFSGSSGSGWCPTVGNGKPGDNGKNGQDGGNISIKIKEVKHKKTGATLYQYEIFKSRENTTTKFKSTATADINIICSGGNGGDGGDGGNGGNSNKCGQGNGANGGNGGSGGRGGNVSITKSSADIDVSFLKINNRSGAGGKAGKGGRGAISGSSGMQGSSATNGELNIQTGSVNFNW